MVPVVYLKRKTLIENNSDDMYTPIKAPSSSSWTLIFGFAYMHELCTLCWGHSQLCGSGGM